MKHMNYNQKLTMDERLFIHCYYYTRFSAAEMAKYLQIPVSRIKNYLQNNKIHLTAEQRNRKQSIQMQIANNSAQFDDFITANYNKIPAKQIGKKIGKTGGFVLQRYKVLGLVVPEEIKQRFIEDSYIKKGTEPPNKGKKLSPEIRAKLEPTFFKKGNVPVNIVPVGTERITDDGYIEVKVKNGALQRNWKLKHRIVWEQHNGPIPKGYNVQFMDKNPQNCVIENLYIISRSEQLKINGYTPEAIAKRFLKMSADEIAYAKTHAPGLIESKAAQIKLKTILNKKQHENKRSDRVV
ncbi:HNH endonuclease signature motif containing protein [Myroides sp. JBRI-B21084]|uniref:HNH endonuclease signature motif containing protein n=1 Tax=Myroides sp. JBRI-B21084 TaxID=3119977 RepID=UPI0026E2C390|nr:HNH endonuclease signature motif containing protein [Paenimyroides cloacae]WKW47288.1 HNH endonuclease signature motif containing protein [Paenimyroides cloacae]